MLSTAELIPLGSEVINGSHRSLYGIPHMLMSRPAVSLRGHAMRGGRQDDTPPLIDRLLHTS